MTYKEGGKVLKIDSEMLAGKYDYAVYWSKVTHWSPPFDGEVLGEAEKARIRKNLENELKSLQIKWL